MSKAVSAPTLGRVQDKQFHVGELVEVNCDHNVEGERVHGWLLGVVVQAVEKMLAIQFREDVYLTDGWMVPDRVLWCRQDSDSIRPNARRRASRLRVRRGLGPARSSR
jgi:hypothetical protein